MNPFLQLPPAKSPERHLYLTELKLWQRSQIAALLFWYVIYTVHSYIHRILSLNQES